jgi:hypothetical protein
VGVSTSSLARHCSSLDLLPAVHAAAVLLLLPAAVWELFTSQPVFEEDLSIGQIFYMSEWLAATCYMHAGSWQMRTSIIFILTSCLQA